MRDLNYNTPFDSDRDEEPFLPIVYRDSKSSTPDSTGLPIETDPLHRAVIQVESGGDPFAINPKSGARGRRQVMLATAGDPGYGVLPAKDDSIEEVDRVGKDYLNAMVEKYDGNIIYAIAAYNQGPGKTDKWIDAGADLNDLNAETRAYIPKVLAALDSVKERPALVVPEHKPVTPLGHFEIEHSNIDYSLYSTPLSAPALEDIPLARRMSAGWAKEKTIFGNIWTVTKAAGLSAISTNKTYKQKLADINEQELREFLEEYPEFRGVSLYDEDLGMLAGRMGVALLDPITLLVPWTKIAKAGKVVSIGVGGGFGAADAALWGHVHQQEVDPTMIGVAAALGGSSSALSDWIGTKFIKSRGGRDQQVADDTSATVRESIAEGKSAIDAIDYASKSGDVVLDGPEIVPKKTTFPPQKTDPKKASLELEDLRTNSVGKPYQVSRETIDYEDTVAAEEVARAGSKFEVDPLFDADIIDDMAKIGKLRTEKIDEIAELTAKIPKIKNVNALTEAEKAEQKIIEGELKTARQELSGLTRDYNNLRLQNKQHVINRGMDGHDLTESIFDRAIKDDKITAGTLEYLIREGTRPAFGALGGYTASHFFLDQDDGWGGIVSFMVAGAGLMRWQRMLQKADISHYDKETGMLIVNKEWKKWMSSTYQKFLTSATASTKLDSLGGAGKIVANLLLDRPGGGTKSVEHRSYVAITEYLRNLGTSLGDSLGDKAVRKVAGEMINFEHMKGYVRPTVGYKGIAGDLETGLTQSQLDEVMRVVPLLKQQRDALARSVKNVKIDFDEIENYGMPQLYNHEAITRNPEEFKNIIREQFKRGKFKDKKLSEKQIDKRVESLYENMFMKGLSQDRIKKRFNEEKLVGDNFKMRPLLDHFEKTRFIKDDDVRKALAEAGFLELDTLDVFYTYADKTIKIREFASTFGPNGDFLEQAFTEVDKAFKGVRNSDSHLAYKNAMKDTVNAFFGKYGDAWHGTHPVASVTIKSLVGLANMMYLTRVGVTSLADFISPWKTSTLAAETKGVTGRFQPGGALHKRAGLQYDNSFELELSALMIHSVDPLQSVTQKLNNMQRGFFRITGLKTVTEAAGKYAFDVGAYRAFEISEQLIKNPKISKALGRELKELGLQEDDLSNLARFKSAEEAFGDDTGREILTRAGQKAMDRDRLVPKVGNRLLFTQHRDPFIRSFGQFMSWTQAKTAQTNALVKRIEDGDAKLAARMLGATVIGTGAVQFLRDTIKPSYDPDRDLPTSDLENFTKKTFELSGELLPWWATKAGSAWKYNFKKGEGITEAASPALSYANDVLKGFGHSIENIAGGDVEGFAQDIVSVTPIAHEINKYLRRWDLPRLEDKSNGSSKSGRSRGMCSGLIL